MKLQDAVQIMNFGDDFLTKKCGKDITCIAGENPIGVKLFKWKETGSIVKLTPKILLYEGKIVQAKKEPVTADEYLIPKYDRHSPHLVSTQDLKKIFDDSAVNCHLYYDDLMELFEDFIEAGYVDTHPRLDLIRTVFKGLQVIRKQAK